MKIQAFTVVEVLVGLLIGSIVVILAVFSFAQISKLHKGFENEHMTHASYKRLHYLISEDVNKAVRIRSTEKSDGLYMIYEASMNGLSYLDSVEYNFTDDALFRMLHNRTDTFNFFIEPMEIQYSNVDPNLITQIHLGVNRTQWTFDKHYAAGTLLTKQLNKPTDWQ